MSFVEDALKQMVNNLIIIINSHDDLFTGEGYKSPSDNSCLKFHDAFLYLS